MRGCLALRQVVHLSRVLRSLLCPLVGFRLSGSCSLSLCTQICLFVTHLPQGASTACHEDCGGLCTKSIVQRSEGFLLM